MSNQVDACLPCREGYFCPEHGMTGDWRDDLKCAAGFYCDGGAIVATDKYCTKGNYCEVGSSSQTPCDAGKYCDEDGLEAPSGDCAPGYECLEGSESATPYENGEPKLCPESHYCPGGSPPIPCDAGTFSPSGVVGLRSADECLTCPAGFYCDGTATPIICREGYFCESGSESLDNECQPGFYCPQGSAAQQPCQAGTYSSTTRSVTCSDCPAGRLCEPDSNGGAQDTNVACPGGYYCPAKTGSKILCPPGTYGADREGLRRITDCSDCPAGYYCDPANNGPISGPTSGLNQPQVCDPRYDCVSGVALSRPIDLSTEGGQLCPIGYYCPNAVVNGVFVAKSECPEGTYGVKSGAQSETECDMCPAGYKCDTAPIVDLSETLCDPGYACPIPANVGDARLIIPCQNENRYCPSGTTDANGYACPEGKYSNARTGQEVNSICADCPSGEICDYDHLNKITSRAPCPNGFYCPTGSSSKTAIGCPVGTYGPTNGLRNVNECLSCPESYYCPYATGPLGDPATATWNVPRNCFDGYACVEGAIMPSPDGLDGTENRPCDAGHFCPAGLKTACPAGTFLETIGGIAGDDCIPCRAGYYCPNTGQDVAPSEDYKCDDSGFFCFSSSAAFRPTDDGSENFGECPLGHFCESGLKYECPDGTYTDNTGSSECSECDAGFICASGSTSSNGVKCPAGYFCEEGASLSTKQPCPKGTYDRTDAASASGLAEVSECSECPLGRYCPWEANEVTTVDSQVCDEGYYCANEYDPGSWSRKPYCNAEMEQSELCNGNTFGFICPAGSICDAGNSEPSVCPENRYCPNFGHTSSDTFACAAGYHCEEASLVPNPSEIIDPVTAGAGSACPTSNYCESGESPVLCPNNKYNPQEGITQETECLDCRPGKECVTDADRITETDCPAGQYCLAGGPSPNEECTNNFVCPEGTPIEEVCLNGEYYDSNDKAACADCPDGSYCDGVTVAEEDDDFNIQSVSPSPCEAGYFCATGSNSVKLESPCAKGESSTASSTTCDACQDGKHCPNIGSAVGTDDEADCYPGYHCLAGSYSPFGRTINNDNELQCPAGTYCETGDSVDCPAGTYRDSVGAGGVNECTPCPAGKSCNSGDRTTYGECPPGSFCPTNGFCDIDTFTYSNLCTATNGLNQPEPITCPQFTFCEADSAAPTVCGYGEYNPNSVTGREECYPCNESPTGQPQTGRCDNGQYTENCIPGQYCPSTASVGINCPAGTFSASDSLNDITQCTKCDDGSYCLDSGGTTVTGQCEAGYVCASSDSAIGSILKRPEDCNYDEFLAPDSDCSGYRCPAGHYCIEGHIGDPTPCPPGTYNMNEIGKSVADCLSCPAGYFCPDEGMVQFTQDLSGSPTNCAAGYYCYTGAETGTPSGSGDDFGECPPGHYCDGASKIQCPGGEFQNESRQESCKICNAGFYCPEGSESEIPCPRGSFCIAGRVVKLNCEILKLQSYEIKKL